MSSDSETVNDGNLTNETRQSILEALLRRFKDNKLPRGAIQDIAEQFNVYRKTVGRIWSRAKECYAKGMNFADVRSRIKGNSGRKRKDRNQIREKISEVPLHKRTTLRTVAFESKVSVGTLFNVMKEGSLRRVSNSIKPALTNENKLQRLQFALKNLVPGSNDFQPMFDVVHVDEKWFYMTKIKKNLYLLPEEEGPVRSCKSKRFITKVMFLAAVARPRWDSHRKTNFDGKIGLWPCITKEPAKRNSKNRAAGTLVTKPFDVNREQYVRLLTEEVIPAIKAKWPLQGKSLPIYIQQDNARPHARIDDERIIKAGTSEGWNISLTCQPPNSPDYNVLDLGFFNAIQALQYQTALKNIDELMTAVTESFEALEIHKLNDVFLSLQMALEESMKNEGCNGYKLPHIGKQCMRETGRLPLVITCSDDSILTAKHAVERLSNH